ncbi:hypothetical protein TNIN_309221, partial [Trichonephila inaurata madagascariensis]
YVESGKQLKGGLERIDDLTAYDSLTTVAKLNSMQ